MPRAKTLTVTSGGVRRDYRVVYRDDSPERAEAVAFFREKADRLFPAMGVPDEVTGMPIKEANTYLRRHPIEERWSLLRIGRQNPIGDDLARLRHLPELDHVQNASDRVTDAGVEHLVHLPAVTHLVRRLRSLRSLDLQSSPHLSRAAVLAAVEEMPWLQDAWPPHDPVRLWVQSGTSQRFVPFVREESGPPVLPSEFWRGIDHPPVDPNPAFTARCTWPALAERGE